MAPTLPGNKTMRAPLSEKIHSHLAAISWSRSPRCGLLAVAANRLRRFLYNAVVFVEHSGALRRILLD